MRVVEPNRYDHAKPFKARRITTKKRLIFIALMLLVLAFSGAWFKNRGGTTNSSTETTPQSAPQDTAQLNGAVASTVDEPQDTVKDTLRTFADNEFKIFYDNLRQPNLEPVSNPPVISGNDIADTRIRDIAEQRGYRLRSSPTGNLVSIDGQRLQKEAADAWTKLKSRASKDGHTMSLVSGYRSVNDQRALFLQRLNAAGGSIEAVAAGNADAIVNKVLVTSSIPGYSKHHTGYTLDLQCAGFVFENFKNSPCNDWITADNYRIAKEYGFIPSYPPMADVQGPDPEAWEYVYVGTDLLYE